MGASISQRPGKCLKYTRRPRRTKSEECLGSKQNLTMGRLFTPLHNLVNIADSHLNANAAVKILELAAVDKDFSYEMEKSFKQIHRSSSLDKHSLQNDYDDKVFIGDDEYSMGECCSLTSNINALKLSTINEHCNRRLTIDVDKDAIFEVDLCKGSRGLGFSVLEYDGYIFIKQLFPLEVASQSGQLQEGDIILSANGNALTHLSSFEALQILRKLDNAVTLVVCRLQQFSKKKPITSSQTFSHFTTPSTTQDRQIQYKEFEIKMKKINGSLGFTLRKDENGHRNHIVRALVKKPAINDGRIEPGDQIISVNDKEIGEMSHQEAVKFLRDCDDEVVLRLRRETLSSSLTSLNSSHFEDNNKTLRKEAVDMLNTLAVKKLKTECEDRQNNNSEGGAICDVQSDSLSDLKYDKKDDGDDDDDDASIFEGANFSCLSSRKSSLNSSRMQNNCGPNDNFAEIADEPISLPTLDANRGKINFQHCDPAYHSINVPTLSATKDSNDTFNQSTLPPLSTSCDNKGLLKWKGIVLDTEIESAADSLDNQITSETIVVELQRNWNSRLGFSLNCENNVTVISAIHANSVAANDGQLRVGDQILEVNGKDVRAVQTDEVIKLLRTVRGAVTIKVDRNYLKKI